MYPQKAYSILFYAESVNYPKMNVSVNWGDNSSLSQEYEGIDCDFFGGGTGRVATTGLIEKVVASSVKRAFLLANTQFLYDVYLNQFEIHAINSGSIDVYVRASKNL